MTRPPVNDLRKRSLRVRILALSAPGSPRARRVRSPHHRWDSGRCRGSPIHPTNRYRRDRCGVSETAASVSSSFRACARGWGDFGIAFLLPRQRPRMVGGTRLVRSFSGTRANSDSHGESYAQLEVGRAMRMLVRMGIRLRRRRKRPKPACRSNLPISATVLGSPRPMARV